MWGKFKVQVPEEKYLEISWVSCGTMNWLEGKYGRVRDDDNGNSVAGLEHNKGPDALILLAALSLLISCS